MKTASDMAAYLKRNGGRLELNYDAKTGTFLVQDGQRIQRSKYLDDALENLAEERRRYDAQMTAMRDKPVESKKPQMQWVSIPATVQPVVYNIPMAPVTVNYSSVPSPPQYPTCSACGSLPGGGSSWIYAPSGLPPGTIELQCAKCNAKWRMIGWVNKPIKLDGGNVEAVGPDGKWHPYQGTP